MQLFAENYCEAIRLDLNQIEKIRFDETQPHDVGKQQIIDLEFNLSKRFTFMAHVFKRFPEVERECALTAFSLKPTVQSFDYVRSCAKLLWGHLINDENNGLNVQQSKCSTRRQTALFNHKRNLHGSDCYDPLAVPSHFYNNQALLKCITDVLAQDLMTVINVPRIKTLTWSVIDWATLEGICLSVLNNDDNIKQRHIEMNMWDATKWLKFYDWQRKEMEQLSAIYRRRDAVKQLRKTKAKAKRNGSIPHLDERADLLGFGPPA